MSPFVVDVHALVCSKRSRADVLQEHRDRPIPDPRRMLQAVQGFDELADIVSFLFKPGRLFDKSELIDLPPEEGGLDTHPVQIPV